MAIKKFRITLNGVVHEVEVEEISSSSAPAPVSAAPAPVAAPAAPKAAPASPAPAAAGAKDVSAPMSGKILSIKVKAGDVIKSGDTLVILEAMKMENEIVATADGKVTSVNVTEGTNVSTGDLLIAIE
ncbi:MAG: biotin/lipoyl-binding protein [Solobacterium sp.]|nr:biotin/lipoyl-binding protein [Solobacterium sp.]